LQDFNLRIVSQASTDRTKTEKHRLWQLKNAMEANSEMFKRLLERIDASTTPEAVQEYLGAHDERRYYELFGEDEDDRYKSAVLTKPHVFAAWVEKGHQTQQDPRPIKMLKEPKTPISQMSRIERQMLFDGWKRDSRKSMLDGLHDEHHRYLKNRGEHDEIQQDIDLRCLQESNIVGITTTGLARNLQLLRKINTKVLICEEAGEVLESHLLTTLLPSLEHIILIGDHQQLRPHVQSYKLRSDNPQGVKYSFDTSLFERLVQPPHATDPRIPFCVLETQRRMHPSISNLIRRTLYPSLSDGENVQNYPDVMGMKHRLFWFGHSYPEAGASGYGGVSTSHTNEFEVQMAIALVSHLMRQGCYGNGDIAVLTPYLGQLHLLRTCMTATFEVSVNERDLQELDEAGQENKKGQERRIAERNSVLQSVRVATVDNFQGEEAKVVIISLVRSNQEQNCGFLNTSNRINVLLSRAQHGMYIIGNSKTYRPVEMWNDVINILDDQGLLGSKLHLQCPRHPDTSLLVSHPNDFPKVSPEAGCQLPCGRKLKCGHACPAKCHSDLLHEAFMCIEKCERRQERCNHACQRRCGELCETKCRNRVVGTTISLVCGHRIEATMCWQLTDPAAARCTAQMQRRVEGCEHSVARLCYQRNATEEEGFRCRARCDAVLECGHRCQRECKDCRMPSREAKGDARVVHGMCIKCY
jgi:hypothetical protein